MVATLCYVLLDGEPQHVSNFVEIKPGCTTRFLLRRLISVAEAHPDPAVPENHVVRPQLERL